MDLQRVLTETEHLLSRHLSVSTRDLKHSELTGPICPDYKIRVEPSSKPVKVIYENIAFIDTMQALVVQESFHIPAFYAPLKDVRIDLMRQSHYRTYCPFKGYATYWSLYAGEEIIENVILGYERPHDEISIIKEYVTFNWRQAHCWYRDGESLYLDVTEPIWIGSNTERAW
ncbi:MAG: DUF427 domain-containing protein [Leptolyngbyaceae cyanobacterium]